MFQCLLIGCKRPAGMRGGVVYVAGSAGMGRRGMMVVEGELLQTFFLIVIINDGRKGLQWRE